MEVLPFEIDPYELSDRSAVYRGELERKDTARTPAEEDWLRMHREMIENMKE